MDPLVSALKARESKTFCSPIPHRYEQMFKSKKYDLEHFGMTFFQRAVCFSACLGLGILSFLYSMFKIVRLSPSGFILPYTISNFLFFIMFGFLLGFRSYLEGLFSKKKRFHSSWFVGCTFLTLYVVLKYDRYLLNLAFCFVQVTSFIMFSLTFVPGGTSGMSSMVNMFFKK
ncbi:ER to Golgi transport membrane protein [Encephalitozoon hellem ATCC 50504]|uniref:Protein transport protein SFT2 n=1 Tax=Encephalitozoon hellem TaxID=27973 RepID=A0A9Q9FA93_ENCHE|nr:ER to Golgi transport membrane protein [Encephalitozoon hellem ATCC 50504]AFM98986.1 ER to Golgi transport membrane protein [Encephalitozoon hellem ATCC 50504]UTX44002.1 Got1/Sft2-like protein [Encephalitozoon hellem]WEL39487.1 Got1/Sft2-like protein [Encephalitozoon hellem]|eukprot:XP_003887967.1 ER to Golgi transport membrane protein [Encephalitozoon hellem ATCC 50504]